MLNSVIKPAIKLLSDSSTKIKIIIIIGLGLVGFSSKWIKNPWKKKNQEVGSPSKKEGEQGVSPLNEEVGSPSKKEGEQGVSPSKKEGEQGGSPSKKEGEQGVSPLIIKPVIKPVIKINFTGE